MRGYDSLYIDGEWVRPAGDSAITVVSPTDEQVIATAPLAGRSEVDSAVTAARAAFADELEKNLPGPSRIEQR